VMMSSWRLQNKMVTLPLTGVDPHVRGPKLLEDQVTKEQKVPGIFDIQLAGGGNGEKRGDFKQPRAECGGRGESCAKVSRERRRCDLPGATDGSTAEC
jgi:hypothetical protein